MYNDVYMTWFPDEISFAFRSINSLLKYVLTSSEHKTFVDIETNKVYDRYSVTNI